MRRAWCGVIYTVWWLGFSEGGNLLPWDNQWSRCFSPQYNDMTVLDLLHVNRGDDKGEMLSREPSKFQPDVVSASRKRPRTSVVSSCMNHMKKLDPPTAPSRNTVEVPLILTRPRSSPPQKEKWNRNNKSAFDAEGGEMCERPKAKLSRVGSACRGAAKRAREVPGEANLSRAAKLLEEDRRKIASIRSLLLHFLEERDCSIKKRLVRCLEEGREYVASGDPRRIQSPRG